MAPTPRNTLRAEYALPPSRAFDTSVGSSNVRLPAILSTPRAKASQFHTLIKRGDERAGQGCRGYGQQDCRELESRERGQAGRWGIKEAHPRRRGVEATAEK
jgi:hypothetical protein